MTRFTDAELDYLQGGQRRLARLATIGADRTPHLSPVGYSHNPVLDAIDIGGMNLEQTKKFRDIQHDDRVAVVIDDVLPPWQPRGVEVRGRAEAVTGADPRIRIHPQRIVSWGIESGAVGDRHARTIPGASS